MTAASSIPVSPAPRRRAGGAALRNLAWLAGDKVVSVVLGLAVFGLIARAYGPEGAGRLSYSAVVLQMGLSLALVCSSAAAMPRLCRLRDGTAARAVANIFAVRLAGSILAALVVAAYLVVAVDDPLRRTVALVMLLAVPLAEPFAAFSAYWISRNRNGRPVASRSVGLAMRVAVVATALWAGASAPVVALAWVAEAAIAALLQAGFLRTVRPARLLARAVRLPRVRAYARFGIRFAVGMWLAQLFLRIDRLWLAERLTAHDFGLYATAMQLVEVWQNVAMMTAGAMAPAFLYRQLQRSRALRDHRRTLALLAGLGLAGLAGAVLFGRPLLVFVYGAPFAEGHGFLMAGFGAAMLFCVDQFVQISITANNRPGLLAVKWTAAIVVAVTTLVLATPHLGAYAGPLGLALGMLSSWAAVAWTYRLADREAA